MRYSTTWPIFRDWWNKMEIKANRTAEFTKVAKYIIAHKNEYQEVEKATGIPWYMAGVIHWREGSGDFGTYLGNGQSLKKRTTIDPKGRGPFKTFLAGAIDAVKVEGWGSIQDWRLEKILYYCLLFNGAYSAQSPYLWGGTNIQTPGKYVSDHNYDPHVWDTQPGCAPILYMIAKLDPTVKFVRET